jgi:hypothetical protein
MPCPAGRGTDLAVQLARRTGAAVVTGELDIPYPLTDVRKAYQQVAERRAQGKLALIP